MSEEFREIEEVGLGQNLKNAAGGVLVGFLMFVGAFPLLWWNEGRAVSTAQMLAEAKGGVVSVDSAEDPARHEGKLVHLQGEIAVDQEVVDSTFGVKVKRPGLERQVEMYQWTERVKTKEEQKVGGGTRRLRPTATARPGRKRRSRRKRSSDRRGMRTLRCLSELERPGKPDRSARLRSTARC